MEIIISLIIVFILSFLLIVTFIYRSNKKEPEEEKINLFLVIFVSILLALPPTLAIAIILLALFGSLNVIDMLFSLHMSMNQLIMLAISVLVYLFTIDSIIEMVVKHIVGKNIVYFLIVLLTRIFVFYMIGLAIDLNQTNSFMISAGVAFVILIIEGLYYKSKGGRFN